MVVPPPDQYASAVDVLTQIVTSLRVGELHLRRTRRLGRWANRFGPYHGTGFHVVLEGGCWFQPQRGPAVRLGEGDVLFMPRGTPHAMADRILSDTAVVRDEYGDGPDLGDGDAAAGHADLLCGAYQLGAGPAHPLLRTMPDVVHLPGGSTSLHHAIKLLEMDASAGQGSRMAQSVVLDLLFVYILRLWLDRTESSPTRFRALSDPDVETVLHHIHRTPARQWTVQDMGALVGLPRTTFARRFSALVGMPPLAYVTWWRLNTAARRLQESGAPLSAIAKQVGYGSEAAFAHAFKRQYGMAAGQFRQARPH